MDLFIDLKSYLITERIYVSIWRCSALIFIQYLTYSKCPSTGLWNVEQIEMLPEEIHQKCSLLSFSPVSSSSCVMVWIPGSSPPVQTLGHSLVSVSDVTRMHIYGTYTVCQCTNQYLLVSGEAV